VVVPKQPLSFSYAGAFHCFYKLPVSKALAFSGASIFSIGSKNFIFLSFNTYNINNTYDTFLRNKSIPSPGSDPGDQFDIFGPGGSSRDGRRKSG
jgi:hypothetical protein